MARPAKTTRLARAANLVATIEKLQSRIGTIQAAIANLTPAKYCAQLLKNGTVSSEWYVQRLVDMGVPFQQAVDSLNNLRDGPGGDKIQPLDETKIKSVMEASTKRVHLGVKCKASEPKLEIARNVYAPHLTLNACKCISK